nr:immunoglobulin light chain junction region [Macaca mulatta]
DYYCCSYRTGIIFVF